MDALTLACVYSFTDAEKWGGMTFIFGSLFCHDVSCFVSITAIQDLSQSFSDLFCGVMQAMGNLSYKKLDRKFQSCR